MKVEPSQYGFSASFLPRPPISNVVDATNYVMLDTGNPLHAFDTTELRQNKLSVIRTEKPIALTTLDEQERLVPADTLLIADGEGPWRSRGDGVRQFSDFRLDIFYYA